MPKLQLSNRTLASSFLLAAALVPAGIWVVLLTTPEPDWGFVSYAFSERNEFRWYFMLFTVSGVASLIAAIAVSFTRRSAVLRSALLSSIVQAVVLAAVGAWVLGCIAGAPAWWLYKAQHEV